MTLTTGGNVLNFNINFYKCLILFGLCFDGITSLKKSMSISNGEMTINNDDVLCSTQYPDESYEILNYGDIDSFCLKKGTGCIKFTINVIQSLNETQDDLFLSYIAETNEVTNILLLQNNTVSTTYLEESVCIDDTCDLTVLVDRGIDWSLVIMNRGSSDPPFEKTVDNPVEYKITLEDCSTIESEEERSMWILLILCLIAASCVIFISLIIYCIMHRYSQRKPQNEDKSSQIIEKNKKMADLFSTSQSFIVQDYDIKVLPISFNIPSSPITTGIASSWTFKFSNSDGSEDEPDTNPNDKNTCTS